ncbi:gliding motility-associated C-terminal domain-containing protein [Cytophaga aurantiaca]|uniref:gliding motility-associated C-terminal domain-containing protein n=1 Tax=Cytophaga aurantiaca TaxID=29530 RepID=UPI000373803C|nr:gliding motility-associated C-terminal domain-containing protein [Cytophaga aurantiaca]
MRKLFVFIILISLRSYSQNLVPNPSFEGYNPCSNAFSCFVQPNLNDPCISSCCGSGLPEFPGRLNNGTYNWWSVNRGYNGFVPSPLYFNACILHANEEQKKYYGNPIQNDWYKPRTGEGFIIIYTFGDFYKDTINLRQYAQVKLRQPLRAGCTYEATCFALLTTNLKYYSGTVVDIQSQVQASDGLGIYISKDSIFFTDETKGYKALTEFLPQVSNPDGYLLSDSINYQKVSGIFIATGGEEWLVIGNFKDNEHTVTASNTHMNSLYAIDDVSVTEWKPNLVSFKDTSLCVDSTLTIKLPDGLKDYKWSTGETTRQITIAGGNGCYTVEASNGCTILRDTFYIHAVPRFATSFTLGRDTFFCKIPASYQLQAPASFDLYEWSTGSHTFSIAIPNAGTYWLKASYACGTLKDTIVVTEFIKPDSVLIPINDTTICSNSSIDLQIAHVSMYSNFAWNDGTTQNHLLVNQANLYNVKAYTPEGCEVRDTIRITTMKPPVLSLKNDTLLCAGTELRRVVSKKTTEQLVWNDGSIDSTYRIKSSGIYWARLSNVCFNTTDSITVSFVDCTVNIPNLITVNDDGKNDYFVIKTEVNRTFELSIYNSWGSQIYHNTTYQNDWNANGLDSGIYFYYLNDPLMNKNYKGWLQVIK